MHVECVVYDAFKYGAAGKGLNKQKTCTFLVSKEAGKTHYSTFVGLKIAQALMYNCMDLVPLTNEQGLETKVIIGMGYGVSLGQNMFCHSPCPDSTVY